MNIVTSRVVEVFICRGQRVFKFRRDQGSLEKGWRQSSSKNFAK